MRPEAALCSLEGEPALGLLSKLGCVSEPLKLLRTGYYLPTTLSLLFLRVLKRFVISVTDEVRVLR